MQVVTHSVDQFVITDTMARHNDTDFVTVSIVVGDERPYTKTVAMGDVNNGTYKPKLSVSAAIPENIDVPVVLTYTIVNRGHTDDPFTVIETALESAVNSLGTQGIDAAKKSAGGAVSAYLGAALGVAAVPLINSCIDEVGKWLEKQAKSVIEYVFKDCDGVVAAAVRIYPSSKELIRIGSLNPTIAEDRGVVHIAKDSPCRTSRYVTDTTISLSQGALFDVNGRWAEGGQPGRIIRHEAGNDIWVDTPTETNVHGMFDDDKNEPPPIYLDMILG